MFADECLARRLADLPEHRREDAAVYLARRVRLTLEEAATRSVCPSPSRKPRPPATAPGTSAGSQPLADVRRELVEWLGADCTICRVNEGSAVDHDNRTGLVRGFLCRDCNLFLERCLHVDGCPFADYLNDPPAAPLGLVYPKRRERRHRSENEALMRVAGRFLAASEVEVRDLMQVLGGGVSGVRGGRSPERGGP